MSRKTSRWLLCLAPAVVALGLFAQVLGFGFAYDDGWTLVENAWLSHPLSELCGLLASGSALANHVPDATRPVMVLVEALERRAFGLRPVGYHFDSLVLYACVCALAGRLALVLTRDRWLALFVACFFAVAPLHAEVVAAINFREDLLAAAGVLGALLLYCSPAAGGRAAGGRAAGGRALAAGALFALGLFAKESAVVLVPLGLLIAFSVPWAAAAMRERRRVLHALGVAFSVWLAWRVPLAVHGDELPLAPHRPFVQLCLRTARFEVLAVVHALVPWLYAPDYWRQPDATWSFVLPFFSLIAGVLLLGRERGTRTPALGFGIALVAPLACVPLLRPVNELADRYFFLGALGGGLVWGSALTRALAAFRCERARPWLALACAPLVVSTWRATSIWRDDRTLWTAAAELTPASPRAWLGVSRVHRLAREPDAADAAMARALNADPDYAPALVTRIYNDLAFGRLATAREHLASLEQRRLGDGGGIAKARRCAALDAEAAARCIEP